MRTTRMNIAYRNAADPKRAGMTLVEIVVVVAILLVLTSVLSFGVYNVFQSTKHQVARLDVQQLGTRVVMYEVAHGAPPSASESLEAARAHPQTSATPNSTRCNAARPLQAARAACAES